MVYRNNSRNWDVDFNYCKHSKSLRENGFLYLVLRRQKCTVGMANSVIPVQTALTEQSE